MLTPHDRFMQAIERRTEACETAAKALIGQGDGFAWLGDYEAAGAKWAQAMTQRVMAENIRTGKET